MSKTPEKAERLANLYVELREILKEVKEGTKGAMQAQDQVNAIQREMNEIIDSFKEKIPR